MAIHTFNCDTEELTDELLYHCGEQRVKFGEVPDSLDIRHHEGKMFRDVFVKSILGKEHRRNYSRSYNYRVILIPETQQDSIETNIKVHIVNILDVGLEFKIQQKFQKTSHCILYKAVLHDQNKIFVYRKTEFKIEEKDVAITEEKHYV